MFSVLGFIAWSIFCFLIGATWAAYKLAKNKLNNYTPESLAPVMTAHEENGTFYLYNKETGEFVAQAATFDGLALEALKNKVTFAYVITDDATFWFINGRVTNKV